MNNILTIFQKEFKVFLRDRRTLFMIFVVPIVFYPLMFNVIGHFSSKNRSELKTTTFKVYLAPSVPAEFQRYFPEDAHIRVLNTVSGEPETLLQDNKIQAIVKMTNNLEIRYLSSERTSRVAAAKLKTTAEAYRDAVVTKRLKEAGLPESAIHPFKIKRKDVASKAKVSGMFLGRILPYMIIIMLFSGAMGFGLEVSTGEKEKGTIATLLVSQASRSQIVLGKLLYVVSIEFLYGILNVIGFVVAIGLQASTIEPGMVKKAGETAAGSGFAFSIMPQTFILLLLLILPIALIAAALIIAIGSYAKSMKEGQTLFTPFLMVFILIGIISMTAPLKIPEYYFWIPVVNTSFSMQELLTFKFQFGHFLSTMLTTTGAAGVIIAITIWMFNRESIHFRS
ncbi:MAG: ABC transporter permease [Acidobacteria bacterium]|nr:ABC transporter permease [Acidobacteriota bacterium]